MTLKKRLTVILTLFIISTSMVSTTYLVLQDYNHDKKNIENSIIQINHLFQATKEGLKQFYTYRAQTAVESSAVKRAIALADKYTLHNLMQPQWTILTNENPHLSKIHFHQADGRSLLRMHDIDKSGDPIASKRPMLAAVHKTQRIQSGFEEGVYGVAFRVAVPVIINNRYSGALEFGIEPDYFVEKINKEIGIDTIIMIKKGPLDNQNGHDEPLLFDTYRIPQMQPLQSEIIAAYAKAQSNADDAFVNINGHTHQINTIPLRNFENRQIGIIIFIKDITSIYAHIESTIISSIVITAMLIVLMLLILNIVLRSLFNKLEFNALFIETVFNSQKNIVLVTDGGRLVHANQAFFDFFGYENLEAFLKEHECICEYFESDERNEYLRTEYNGSRWNDQLIQKPDAGQKVKITNRSKTYIFSLNAKRMLFQNEQRDVIVMTDITLLTKMANTDPLTGIANRKRFNHILQIERNIASRHHHPLSVIMIDIDHFKSVNDTYGHDCGDTVLIDISQLLRERIRQSDFLARWGGEEFIILLSHTDAQQALGVAETLRHSIESHAFAIAGKLTSSFGVAQLNASENPDQLIKRADEALYKAKENGRNRVEYST